MQVLPGNGYFPEGSIIDEETSKTVISKVYSLEQMYRKTAVSLAGNWRSIELCRCNNAEAE